MSMQAPLEVRTPFFPSNYLIFASQFLAISLQRVRNETNFEIYLKNLGLEHIANLPKKDLVWHTEFLNNSKDELGERARLSSLKTG